MWGEDAEEHGKTMTVPCPYCSKEATLVSGDLIYPRRSDLHCLRLWACLPCGAWVGCHAGTTQPLGRLANAELRRAKMAAHAAFDPLWRFKNQPQVRNAAYSWLAKQLGIPRDECHIGMFDIEQCQQVVAICTRLRLTNQGQVA